MVEQVQQKVIRYQWDIVWLNVVLMAVVHSLFLYLYYLRYFTDAKIKIQTVLFAKMIGFVSMVGVTAGAHRLWSHKSYKCSLPCQAVLAVIVSLTYQNTIYVWCRDHRLHHKFSETDADPHNAKRGFFFSHVGWLLVRKHKDVMAKGKSIDMSDLKANPVIMFQHRYYYFLVIPWAFVMPVLVPWYFWNEYPGYAFLWTIGTYVFTLNATWCVNSFAHIYGGKPYDSEIGPTENLLTQYLNLGEGFHNFHHTFPCDYRASEHGFEGRNFTAGFIDFLALLGCVTERKTTPRELIQKRAERTGDRISSRKPLNNFKSFVLGCMLFIAV